MSTGAVTAADSDLASCHTCCKLSPASLHRCPRCGATLHLRITDSVQRTVALLITATILYIPANVYPIMVTEYLGVPEASTIMGGVVVLASILAYPRPARSWAASWCW
jgi:paraquat-inducible protein A